MTTEHKYDIKNITETQKNFLEFCKEFGWGKLEVTIHNGEPCYSKELERTHRHIKN